MNPKKFLETTLKKSTQHRLTSKEKEYIEKNGVISYIIKQIKRKGYRKWKLSDFASKRIIEVVNKSVNNNKPIVFRIRFGGYKLWKLKTAPEVDWAEFFTISYICKYLSPIFRAYKYGVELIIASDDFMVERLDNIPLIQTKKYLDTFNKMLTSFRKYFPPNFSIKIVRNIELYKSDYDFQKEFELTMKSVEEKWYLQAPLNVDKAIKAAKLNMSWNGVKNLGLLDQKEKNRIILESVKLHEVLMQLRTINDFYEKQNDVIFLSSFPSQKAIAIGSSKTSSVKFWVGSGVLERHEDDYYGRIVSLRQINSLNDVPHTEITTNLIPLKNFASIKIYKKHFDFTKK